MQLSRVRRHMELYCLRSRSIVFCNEAVLRLGEEPPFAKASAAKARVRFRRFRSLLRRVLFELRQFRIHVVPRLGVACEDVELRMKQAWIIQTRGSDAVSVLGDTAEKS